MKRYSPELELQLYFLYTCRRQVEKMQRLNPPAKIMEHANNSLVKRLDYLTQEGMPPEELDGALRERWMEFEGYELQNAKLQRCLTHKATVQARIRAGVGLDNPQTFACQLGVDCMECDCFTEASEDQQGFFDVGRDVFTGEDMPEFKVDLDEEEDTF